MAPVRISDFAFDLTVRFGEHLDLSLFLKDRTLVTDNASNRPKIAGASVPKAVAPLNNVGRLFLSSNDYGFEKHFAS